MAPAFGQDGRVGRLELEADADLALVSFHGVEALNDVFTYDVDCLATTPDVPLDSLIGTHATVTVESHDGSDVYFDGVIVEANWLGSGEKGQRYHLRLKPWFHLASLRRNQRIFHEMTVADILEELLGAYGGVGALELRLERDYPVLEYTVQFRESDFDFACRMMERHGISYHFEHGQLAHQMVLSDEVETHASIGMRPFKPVEGHHLEEIDHFNLWAPARRMTTGAIRLTDYNFKTPNAAMEADSVGDASYSNGQIESFDWPGDYLDQGQGQGVAALRTDQERGQDQRYAAAGDIVALRAGSRVELGGDPVPGTGAEYLCLSATHHYAANSYGSGKEGEAATYSAQYSLMPSAAPLAPEIKTNLALAQGPQTARVVGEGEIDVDEYGRILVQFHWDLAGAWSMRCRVGQSWAGQGWGGMVIPRIGMEVVVEFLEGDPDKPLVTGCVYNGKNTVPYDLPAHKTRSTFRTNSHEASGFNELRFEDAGGEEEVFMHAQKDHNTVIENDESHAIGHDRSKSVGNDQTETIGHDKTITVANDHTETIGANKTETIKDDYATTVTDGDQKVTVATGKHTTVVKSDKLTNVQSGNDTTVLDEGDRTVVLSAGSHYRTVNGDVVTISETGSVVVQASKAIVLEAPNILLKANDSNFISISQGTIVIEGGQTLINPRESAPG